eukprot:Partr_v1_DN28977_c1_g2_i3_m25303 putative BTAF1 RNA polymerase II, B-TFIID transcription factor-associated, 170kDa (Mot1 homolog, S. cerevisiae)
MASRLDRLVELLLTGSNSAVKSTAALQLGEIVKARPDDCQLLLEKIVPLLRNQQWDARMAAGDAMENIARNMSAWCPSKTGTLVITKLDSERNLNSKPAQLSFSQFNLNDVLTKGDALLASAGADYELGLDMSNMDARQRLDAQRRQIQMKMGIEFNQYDQLIDDNDIVDVAADDSTAARGAQSNVAEKIGATGNSVNLSSREMARMKRLQKKRRKAAIISDNTAGANDEMQIAGNLRHVETRDSVLQCCGEDDIVLTIGSQKSPIANVSDSDNGALVVDSISDAPVYGSELEENAFEPLCEYLCIDIFDPKWEVRHGAALALRAIVNIIGGSGGKMSTIFLTQVQLSKYLARIEGLDVSSVLQRLEISRKLDDIVIEQVLALVNEEQNKRWLDDIAIRLLCVFALDRFSDFIGDSVVVPVRETCAQALGVIVRSMQSSDSVWNIIKLGISPLYLGSHSSAALKFSAVLGLKYVLATRRDMIDSFLSLESINQMLRDGLSHADDDIRAIVASTMVPVSKDVVRIFPFEQVVEIISHLWASLMDLDDLSASTGSIMELIASLMSLPEISSRMTSDNSSAFDMSIFSDTYFPRLFPFMRHNTRTVRVSVIKTIKVLVPILLELSICLEETFSDLLEYLMQTCLLEHDGTISYSAKELLSFLLRILTTKPELYVALQRSIVKNRFLERWCILITAPIGQTMAFQYLPLSGSGWIERGINKSKSVTKLHDHVISAQDSAMIAQDFEVYAAEEILQVRDNAMRCLAIAFAEVSFKPTVESQSIMAAAFEVLSTLFPRKGLSWASQTFLLATFLNAWVDRILEIFGDVTALHFSEFLQTRTSDTSLILVNEFAKAFSSELVQNLYSNDEGRFFEDVAAASRLRMDTLELLTMVARACSVDFGIFPPIPSVENGFKFNDAKTIVNTWIPNIMADCGVASTETIGKMLAGVNEQLSTHDGSSGSAFSRMIASMAGALVSLGSFLSHPISAPDGVPKLTPLIKSLVNSIKFEKCQWIQSRD